MERAVISFVVNRIGDQLIEEAVFLKDVRPRIERLHRDLRAINCFLEAADAKQEEDPRVRNWVSDIRDVAYDAEDVVDMFILKAEALRRKIFVKRIFQKLRCLHNLGKKIDDIQTNLQDISRRREILGIKNIGEGTSTSTQMLQNLRRTTPRAEKHVIVGLNEEAEKLVKQLTTGDPRRRVVSIVGMGGIGKTTLAKKIYNHSRVVDHFQSCRAWVYVSQDCRPRDIFQQILNQFPYTPTEDEARKIEKLQENELGNFLHDQLKEKRFLVVLDDIWRSDDWKCLANAFPEESDGSRLLLTSRNKDVALQADARSVPYEVKLLSDAESWKLFCRSAIPDNVTESCPPELKEFGKRMVKKCAGLPLAIVVLGGLLSSKKQLSTEWEKVLKNLQAHFSSDKGVDALLSLSYIDLPHNLRSCFLYLGLFPEDQIIPTRKLLLLWMAEGFIPQQDERRMEDTAEDYLNELISRNLVQVVTLSVNERATKCQIHDVVRDLCVKRAKEQNLFEIKKSVFSLPSTSSSFPSTKSRRQGIYFDLKRYASTEHSTPYIRSLFFFRFEDGWSRLDFICEEFKLLRVLDLEGSFIEIPRAIGKLIHLRYLRLNSQHSSYFPTYLGNLRSLQTLDINNFSEVSTKMQNMENLRHLFISYERQDGKPLRIDTLRNLQTLSGIWFSDLQQNDTSKLPNLHKLKIKMGFDLEVSQFSNSIAKLENLRSLYLERLRNPFHPGNFRSLILEQFQRFHPETSSYPFDLYSLNPCDFEDSDAPSVPSFVMNSWLHLSKLHLKGSIKQLPRAHEFSPNLTQLTLEWIMLHSDPLAILEKLPKLLILRLRMYTKLRQGVLQVSANGFPQLKILQLANLHQMKSLNINEGGMSKLTQLQNLFCVLNIQGLSELLHLQKVDVIDSYLDADRWASTFHHSSNWRHTKRRLYGEKELWHFYRR